MSYKYASVVILKNVLEKNLYVLKEFAGTLNALMILNATKAFQIDV